MNTIIEKRKKALSVMPLKSSSTIGAALAFLGFNRSIPMLHGSQGCTAFGKVFFVRHFREPIPLQTTAMDQVSSVMGSEDNIIEGLKTICEKSAPAMIGLPTTGLAETQGSDITTAVGGFRKKYPEFDHIPVIPVSTPDYTGCTESGFATAVTALIDVLVPPAADAGTRPGLRKKQVTVLVGSYLTPGDVEVLKEMIESFGLRPVVVPDLSDSLDGHLTDTDFSPLTIGGTAVNELPELGNSLATVVVGASLYKAADLLAELTGVPDFRFDHLMGLDAVDALVSALSEISGQPVPEKLERGRAQLQDAMLDTHFMLGLTRVAIAADPDLLKAFSDLVAGMGAQTVAAVAPANAAVLKTVAADMVKLGDLEELEKLAVKNDAEILISNSHAADTSRRLSIPLLRAGFPQYDLVGGYQRVWIGYQGTKQTLFDMANMLLELERGEIEPYHSVYSQKNASQTTSKQTPELHHVDETAIDYRGRHH
ncbi:MAG: nitrogenase iron-molybdenum cofactor biosynthesis protein NifN [Gammaproteobacteria bacterium]